MVPIGGKSQLCFDRFCRLAGRQKKECYRAWIEASAPWDVNSNALKKMYNSVSRANKRAIALAKSELVKD